MLGLGLRLQLSLLEHEPDQPTGDSASSTLPCHRRHDHGENRLIPSLVADGGYAKDVSSLMFAIGQLNRYQIQPLFQFYVDLDAKDPKYNIGQLSQGGTGLPAALYLGNSTDIQ
jgi:hypothetical protein